VDAQSVKNTDTAKHKGYDAGKKVSGIKRHIAVDTQGLPHAITVTTADVNDRDGAVLMFLLNDERLAHVSNVLVDGGYTGERFAALTHQILGANVEVAKRSELHKFVVIPQRWSLSALSPGWKNAGDSGRTAKESFTPASSLLLLLSSPYQNLKRS